MALVQFVPEITLGIVQSCVKHPHTDTDTDWKLIGIKMNWCLSNCFSALRIFSPDNSFLGSDIGPVSYLGPGGRTRWPHMRSLKACESVILNTENTKVSQEKPGYHSSVPCLWDTSQSQLMAQVPWLVIVVVNAEFATSHPRGTKQGQHGPSWWACWAEGDAETTETKWRSSSKDNRFFLSSWEEV